MDDRPRRRVRLVVSWLVVVASALAWPRARAQEGERDVRVGVPQNRPMVFVDDDGTVRGISADVLRHVAEREGWRVSYVPGDWEQCLQGLAEGQIDLLVDIAYSQERERQYDFTDGNVLLNWGRLYAAPGVTVDSILDVRGRRIAVMEGDIYYEEFRGLAESFDLECEVLHTPSYAAVLEAVAAGEADAGITSRLFGAMREGELPIRTTPVLFTPVDLRFATTAGRNADLLAALDRGLEELKADEDSAYYRSLERWLGRNGPPLIPEWLPWVLLAAACLLAGAVGLNLYLRSRLRHETASLRKAEALLRQTERLSRAGGWEYDVASQEITWTDEVYRIYGLPRDEHDPSDIERNLAFYAPEDREKIRAAFQRCVETGEPYDLELKFRDASGWDMYVRTMGEARKVNGRLVRVYGNIMDVTERKRSEEALAQSERRYRTTLDNMLEGCQIIDREWRYLYVNPAAAAHGKKSVEELVGRTMMEAYPGIEDTGLFAELKQCMDERVQKRIENEFVFANGSAGCFDLLVQPVPEGLFVTSVDITERRDATNALEESEQRYRALFEGAIEGILVAELEKKTFRYANPAICAMLGYTHEEMLQLGVKDIHPPEDLPHVMAVFEAQARGDLSLAREIPCLCKDGTVILADVNTARIEIDGRPCLVGFFTDVTEARRLEAQKENLEEQLRQTQRLEAIGTLAGGVAHDFNNILTGIRGFTSFARENAPEGSPEHTDLGEVLRLVDRAENLTRQMLAFSRRQPLEPRVLNMNDTVRNLTKMLKRLLGEDIAVEFLPAEGLGNVKADPGQVEQVLMNLALNARDAMPEGGQLTIETDNVELDGDYVGTHVGVKPGRYVMLAVSDTGHGMDEATLRRAFEPFFTTKGLGKGTGLGLSTIYGIVKQHGGNVWAYSEPGQGTTFRVYLPRVDEPVHGPRREPGPLHPGGHETILLLEDDPHVRQIVMRILAEHGYTVLGAGSPGEAGGILAERGEDVSLVLTDVVLPECNGRTFYEGARAQHPHLRVLYMSGYTDNAIVHHGVLDEGTPFIPKPLNPRDLVLKVREVLDAPPPQEGD